MAIPLHQEKVKFWQAQDIGGVDLLRATYFTHTFSRHVHNGYAIGIIERGAETFYYRGATHVAPAGSVVVINPDEVHTGQAVVTEEGWSYRMLYPETELVTQAAGSAFEHWQGIPNFINPVIWDESLVPLIRRLHVMLETSASALERETVFIATLAQLIARHATGRVEPRALDGSTRSINWAREYLEAHFDENVSLDQLAHIANLSPYHFTRTFSQVIGLPPHAYLNHIRVERAKTLLAQGYPIAHIAAETGFVDQSHFTRRFKRIVGVTPGQYALNSKNVQDDLA
ncbi:MAG TPA: AraC family transcriptional regulator [Anaerolineae bacterium]|nr:AraC family transcriptional regulator [Anaerolineae bacterium]